MRVIVAQRYEEGGLPLRDWPAAPMRGFEGNLDLAEEYSRKLKRWILRARLLALEPGEDPIPWLEDAVVLRIQRGKMLITGCERDSMGSNEHRQTWYVQVHSREMRVRAARLYEDGGHPVPNWRTSCTSQVDGILDLGEEYNGRLQRHHLQARLMPFDAGTDPLPLLEDAVVRFIRGQIMTITGFDRDEQTGQEHKQAWYVEVMQAE
jgi:hypothetical protein